MMKKNVGNENRGALGTPLVIVLSLFLSVSVVMKAQPLHAGTDRIVMECSPPLPGTSLTVYSQGMALIKEKRTVSLPMGASEVRCTDVPETIEPQSVSVRFLSSPEKVSVQEQRFDPGVIDPQSLMDFYIGKRVLLVERSSTTLEEKKTEAQLLSTRSGNVYRIGKDIHIGHPGQVVLPDYSGEINERPFIAWWVSATEACEQDVEVSYLADGLSWAADYVLLLNENDGVSRLSAWITLSNRSGRDFENSTVSLVAGEVQRQKKPEPMLDSAKAERVMAAAAPAPPVVETPFFEYHLYRVPQKVSLGANMMHQIAFFSVPNVPSRKEFVFRSSPSWGRGRFGEPEKSRAAVEIIMQNKPDGGIARALPSGTVRIYKAAEGEELLLVGEDVIRPASLGTEVKIKAGKAFDVEMERKLVTFQKLGPTTVQEGYEMTVKNAKPEDVSVRLVEGLYGDWEIIKSNREWKKADAQSIEFMIPVAARGQTVVSYIANLQR